ncbi:cyclic lactone autoinducer peptide [Cohnella pontilimi]|uniref:Cyclic lactone autoinducer peptide n=1 Tax=Cohnella pontilimi TaxID=2564100 RepID=A0A4U0F314_9BACL|nr:cyclic lactone autoinducer peptide [Cohnella pontilimi]TJY38937.1 cyclic lactone autoinducer peptide [Cohnella pontilimi]
MKKKLLQFTASGLLLLASGLVLTACSYFWHQPEVPEELLQAKEG